MAAAIAEFITGTLPTDPYRLSKPLRFELAGWRVARRGHYRVTFRIIDDGKILYVGRIEHRAHLYRSDVRPLHHKIVGKKKQSQ